MGAQPKETRNGKISLTQRQGLCPGNVLKPQGQLLGFPAFGPLVCCGNYGPLSAGPLLPPHGMQSQAATKSLPQPRPRAVQWICKEDASKKIMLNLTKQPYMAYMAYMALLRGSEVGNEMDMGLFQDRVHVETHDVFEK